MDEKTHYDVFISYRSNDFALAERLNAQLVREGLRVWFDRARLAPGCDWHREIEAGCEASRIIVPVVTPDWKTSHWCRFETYGAERVVPLLFAGEWPQVAPAPLQHFQYFDLRQPESADWRTIFSAIRKYLAEPAPEKPPRLASLPYAHNPYFVGRERLLLDIHEHLHPAPTTALTEGSAHVITGVGGIGKTSLAREYAEKFWRLYRDLLWVQADRAPLANEFARIAIELRLIQHPSKDVNEDASAALRELNARTPRLLILDNAIDEQSVQRWLPTTGACKTIITSRFTGWSPVMHAIGIEVLTREAARDLLTRRSRLDSGSQLRGADQLAEELGYLPLALEHAAALMRKLRVDFDHYLTLYGMQRQKLLAERFLGGTQYSDSVATAWSTTIAHLSERSKSILKLISHLAPEDIPVSLLEKAEWMPRSFALRTRRALQLILRMLFRIQTKAVPDSLALRQALGELAEYSMIQFQRDAIGVHRLVQAVQMDEQSKQSRRAWAKRAVVAVYHAFPTADYENFVQCARLLPHARVAGAAVSRWKFRFGQAALLLNQVAIYLERRGQYAEAEPLYLQAVEIWRLSLLGRFNPYLAIGLSNLGLLYNEQGNYSAAEQVLHRALALRRKFRQKCDPQVATILSGLAIVHKSRGDLAAMEACYLEANKIQRTTVGEHDQQYAEGLSNLAGVYGDTKRYSDAERFYREALEITRQTSGDNHPKFAQMSQNLAVLYYRLERYAEAESLYCDALAKREESLGVDHPDLAYILTNLGKLYRDQKKHEQAISVLVRAAKIRRDTFGDKHPELARTLSYLGTVYEACGKSKEAESAHQQAVEIACAALRENDPLTATVLQNYDAFRHAAEAGGGRAVDATSAGD